MSGPHLFDRVKETTTTTGTGTITLAGAATGYRSFAVVGNGNTCYYAIVGGAEWEVGIGTYTSSGTTLARTRVLASSNSGSAVNFSAGSKDVFLTAPAQAFPYWLRGDPRTPPASPNAKDEEWDDSSGMSGTGNGLDAKWTTFGASQTRSYAGGKLILTGTASGGISANVTGMWQSQPSTPYTVTVELVLPKRQNYNFMLVGFRRASTGYMLAGCLMDNSTNLNVQMQVHAYTANTTRSRGDIQTADISQSRRIFIRGKNDGTNAIFYYSMSGVEGTFIQWYTETLATQFSTNVPDQFFIGLDPFNTTTPIGEFGAVRVS